MSNGMFKEEAYASSLKTGPTLSIQSSLHEKHRKDLIDEAVGEVDQLVLKLRRWENKSALAMLFTLFLTCFLFFSWLNAKPSELSNALLPEVVSDLKTSAQETGKDDNSHFETVIEPPRGILEGPAMKFLVISSLVISLTLALAFESFFGGLFFLALGIILANAQSIYDEFIESPIEESSVIESSLPMDVGYLMGKLIESDDPQSFWRAYVNKQIVPSLLVELAEQKQWPILSALISMTEPSDARLFTELQLKLLSGQELSEALLFKVHQAGFRSPASAPGSDAEMIERAALGSAFSQHAIESIQERSSWKSTQNTLLVITPLVGLFSILVALICRHFKLRITRIQQWVGNAQKDLELNEKVITPAVGAINPQIPNNLVTKQPDRFSTRVKLKKQAQRRSSEDKPRECFSSDTSSDSICYDTVMDSYSSLSD